jgi:enamine deaminase RidA (YjgF/YER057c/UK114 family)
MIEQKITELGYQLPEAPRPLAAYIPATVCEKMVYTAGQINLLNGVLKYEGKVGKDLSL